MTSKITAICLCLDKRKEHWLELGRQAAEFGIEFIPFIAGDGSDKTLAYDHIDEVNPDVSRWRYGAPHLKHHHYNAMVCHQKMIALAKRRGFTQVLLLEDDAYICSRFNEVLNSFEYDYKKIIDDADLVYYGWWMGPEDDKFNIDVEEYWNKNKHPRIQIMHPSIRTGGLHGLLVRESVYDYILSLPLNNCIDGQLCDASDRFLSVLVLPKIIHVKSMFSETEGVVFNRLFL